MVGWSSSAWALFLLAMAGAVVVADEKTRDRGEGEKTPPSVDLDGVWRGFVVDGRGEQPDRGSVRLELAIQGNAIRAERLDGQRGPLGQGTYRIKAGRPTLMDGIEGRTRGRARTYQGICEIEDDTIKWCVATPGNRRPRTFETKGQQFLLILKRQKE